MSQADEHSALMAQFTFVNVTHPQELNSAQTQTAVRSHVARKDGLGAELGLASGLDGNNHHSEYTTPTYRSIVEISQGGNDDADLIDQNYFAAEQWFAVSPIFASSSPEDQALFLSGKHCISSSIASSIMVVDLANHESSKLNPPDTRLAHYRFVG